LGAADFARVAVARFAGFGVGSGSGLPAASTATSLGTVSVAASAAASWAPATPIVLESVRWQLSHATIVRTSAPRCRSSRRRFRVRSQKEQYPVSMVTLICPGLRFIVT
jgi:hypothetical protein